MERAPRTTSCAWVLCHCKSKWRLATEAMVRGPARPTERTPLRSAPAPPPPSALVLLRQRCVARGKATVLAAATKIFCGGCCWQAAAFLAQDAGCGTGSISFAIIAGLGDALGVCVGHALLTALEAAWARRHGREWPSHNGGGEVGRAARRRRWCALTGALALGAFLSGAAWQQLLDAYTAPGHNEGGAAASFGASMVMVGVGCGLFFWLGITAGRLLLGLPRALLLDGTLSAACAGASAFFVGTDSRSFHGGNWLRAAVGERRGLSRGADCLRAGLSTLLGFVAVSVLMVNPFLPQGYSWADGPGDERGAARAAGAVNPQDGGGGGGGGAAHASGVAVELGEEERGGSGRRVALLGAPSDVL